MCVRSCQFLFVETHCFSSFLQIQIDFCKIYGKKSNLFTRIFMFCGFRSFDNLAKDWLNQLHNGRNKSTSLQTLPKGIHQCLSFGPYINSGLTHVNNYTFHTIFVPHYAIKEHTTNDQWHCQHRSLTRNRTNELILISIVFQDIRTSHGEPVFTRQIPIKWLLQTGLFLKCEDLKLMQTQYFLKTEFPCSDKYLVKSFVCVGLHRPLYSSSIAFLAKTWVLMLQIKRCSLRDKYLVSSAKHFVNYKPNQKWFSFYNQMQWKRLCLKPLIF